MSSHDEFQDLEERIRHTKPPTMPISPAFKNQLRQQLMEKNNNMKNPRFSFGQLASLGGLALVLLIPLFFWLSQTNSGIVQMPATTSPLDNPHPAGAAASITTTPTPPPPSTIENTTNDQVWLDTAWPAQLSHITSQDTIQLTLGIALESLPEAELLVKLIEQEENGMGLGQLTKSVMVEEGEGTVYMELDLTQLENLQKDTTPLMLNILLRDPTGNSEKLLYLNTFDGWTVTKSNPQMAEAKIISVSEPQPVEEPNIPADAFYDLTITVEYGLMGYPQAVLVVGYEYDDGDNGYGSGSDLILITAGNHEKSTTLRLNRDYFNPDGSGQEGLQLFAHINVYDDTLGEYVNIYPGGLELPDAEKYASMPASLDTIHVNHAAWTVNELGQRELILNLNYDLQSQPEATLTAHIANNPPVETTITAGQETISLILPSHNSFPDDLNNIQVVMSLPQQDISTQHTLPPFNPEQSVINHLRILHTDVTTQTSPTGNIRVNIALLVEYNLNDDYTAGNITFSNRYQYTNPNGGGGGGGGGGGLAQPIEPGLGTVVFQFSVEASNLSDVLQNMTLEIGLVGTQPNGQTQQLHMLNEADIEIIP